MKTIHIGGIVQSTGTVETFVAATRPRLIHNMNEWFSKFFVVGDQNLMLLPPLDDWSHSKIDETFWSVNFPNEEWSVWMRAEPTRLQ